MDSESLRTASTYLNNLLLARGFLRNSEPIDFVKPSKESRAQIINLVHDLVLRGDRDKDQRESISFSLRQLRANEARKNADFERLREKSEESARVAAQAQTGERTARDEVKKVERSLKTLQDQSARLKTALAQVKTQCANDVRKRDLELGRLKAHLQGQQRGNKAAVTAPGIAITGGRDARRQGMGAEGRDLRDPEYSLKQETTDFLTQLSQSLSDENDGLIGLLREALGTMKDLLGMPANSRAIPDSAIGSRGSNDEMAESKQSGMLQTLPTSYETLASEMDSTLSHLKRILTNPNFVSVDEVEMREEEIIRLRQGWEHMENRWRDVLVMMEGWRRRMDTGETINMDDLRLGMGMVSPRREGMADVGAHIQDVDESMVDDDASDIPLPDDDEDGNESSIMMEPPRLSGSLAALSASKRKRDILDPPQSFDLRPPGTAQKSPARSTALPAEEPDFIAEKEELLEPEGERSEQIAEAQMTVNEKLAAVAKEAADAQAARDARAEQEKEGFTAKGRYSLGQLDGAGDVDELQDDDTLGKMPSPVKKTKIRGRARRRKSTLSRDELEAMLVFDGDE